MSKDLVFHTTAVSASARAQVKGQKPAVIWLTGLSGAGKSTIANALEQALVDKGRHTFLLDGDNLRMGLCKDLGFADADRVENIRRVAEVSKLLVDAGLIVITAFISPFQQDRAMARDVIGPDEFVEVFVDTSLEECERRDPKGLYSKARAGEIKNFTGIDSAYEKPTDPDISINTVAEPLSVSIGCVLEYLDKRFGQ
ncbi:adenylyl-sulfate kinase [Pseudomonas sp. MDT1-85]